MKFPTKSTFLSIGFAVAKLEGLKPSCARLRTAWAVRSSRFTKIMASAALGDATSAQRSTSYAVTRRDGNSTWSWRGRWTGWAVVCRTWSASCLKRAMIAERVRAGLARARSEGKRLGRPPIAPALEKRVREALAAPGRPGVRVIAKQFGVDPGTVQRISRPFDRVVAIVP